MTYALMASFFVFADFFGAGRFFSFGFGTVGGGGGVFALAAPATALDDELLDVGAGSVDEREPAP